MKFKNFSLIIAVGLGIIACSDNSGIPANTAVGNNTSQEETTFANGPESTKSSMWKYIINNAQRTVDKYAAKRNPNAVFVGNNQQVDFIRQYGGEYEGRYLLKIVNEQGENTSFAMLLPLFDEYAPSEGLDDEGMLWEVVEAKFNGISF